MPVELTPQAGDHAPVVIRLSGTVDRDDVGRAVRTIDDALADGPPIGIVIDMSELDDASLGALARDAEFELSMLSRLDRFARLALVGAPGWIAMLSSAGGRLLPDVRVRTFDRGEVQAATVWAKERGDDASPASDEAGGDGVSLIHTASGDILAFEIDGDMTSESLAPLVDRALAAYDRGGKIDLLARVKRIGRIDWGLFTDERYRRVKLEGFSHIRRYAIVGAPDWMAAAAGLAGRASKIDIRTFDAEEEGKAWNWLGSAESGTA